jgi:hypothetical protein
MQTPTSKRRIPLRWIFLAVLVVGLGLIWGWMRGGPSEAQAFKEEMRAKGYPVSMEELAAKNEVPKGELNAAPRILALLEAYEQDESLHGDPQRAMELREALALSYCRFPIDRIPPFDQSHMSLGAFKIGGRVLQAQAVQSWELGDQETATANLIALLQLGRALRNHPTAIHWLIGLAVNGMARSTMEQMLPSQPFERPHLDRIAEELDLDLDQVEIDHVLVGEMCLALFMFDDFYGYARAQAGGVEPPGFRRLMAKTTSVFYEATVLRMDYRAYRKSIQALIDAGTQPSRANWNIGQDLQKDLTRFHTLTGLLIPGYERSLQKQLRFITEQRAMRTAVAIEQYRADHNGELPANLSELIPEYLSAVFEDPMEETSSPLKYRVRDPGYVVYGIGETFVDDGGISQRKGVRAAADTVGAWDYTFEVGR